MVAMSKVVDRAAWLAEVDALRVREKAHTREGDAIAAARRRLPMTAMDPAITVVGADGPVPLNVLLPAAFTTADLAERRERQTP